MDSPPARHAFRLVILGALLVYGLVGGMVVLMQFQPGFMGMAHGSEPQHRVHDLTFGLLLAVAALGLIAQLWKPSRNVAAQVMALIPWIALLLAFAMAMEPLRFAPAPILAALTLLAAAFHPARREVWRSLGVRRASPVMVALVIVAAVPLVAGAFANISLQRTLSNDHAALGHYGFMAALSLTIVGIGLLASARPTGWRLVALVTGLLPVVLGIASLVYPDNDSSLSQIRAFAAIAWGIVFVAVSRLAGNNSRRFEWDAERAPEPEVVTLNSRTLIVIAVVVMLAAVLVIMHATGGDFPRHAPR